MSQKKAIHSVLNTAHVIASSYLGDLDDQDFMTRPHEQCNHINWQVGHLIASDHQMVSEVAPDAMPPLPEGFTEKYCKETQTVDDFDRFERKETLFKLMETQKEAIAKIVDEIDESEFEKPAPESMQAYCPTVGDLFCMVGSHWTMHCGQWVIVRRMKDKPIVI